MIKNKKLSIIVLMALLLAFVLTLAACDIYTLEYKCEEGGTIQGKALQQVLEGNNGKTVTAVPDEGYEFIGWSDGVETASRQEKSVNDDLTVTALFKKLDKVPHACESRCEVCDNCLNYDCLEPDCLNKCKCEPTHICVSECIVCGGCLNHSCKDALCKIKCDCLTNPHPCNSKCETCGGCLNLDCAHKVCSNKCTCVVVPQHNCESVCPVCFGCLNDNCLDTACSDKCTCGILPPSPEHTCESICDICGNCLNPDCDETACLNKCDNTHQQVSEYVFTLINNGTAYAVSANNRAFKRYHIPDEYNGLPVTEIAANGFKGCMAEAIYIPDSVVKIGENAFANSLGCDFFGMVNVREIGAGAFYRTTCSFYIAPCYNEHACSSVCPLCGECTDDYCKGGYCINKCKHYNSNSTAPSSETIDGLYFSLNNRGTGYDVSVSDDSVTVVNIPATVNGLPVLSLENYAFSHCDNLVSVTIPSTVRIIGNGAFSSCDNLETIIIEGNIEYVGTSAFSSSSKVSIYINGEPSHTCKSLCHMCQKCTDAACTQRACVNKCDNDPIVHAIFRFTLINNGTAYAVSVNDKLQKRYEIPSTYNGLPVTEIADHAFAGVNGAEVIVPNSIVKIGDYAFYNTRSIKLYGMLNVKEIGFAALSHSFVTYIYFTDCSDHSCNSVCDKCGLCYDQYCYREECLPKCSSKTYSAPSHVCEKVCSDCGLCLDADCGYTECKSKCENAVHTGMRFYWNESRNGYEVGSSYNKDVAVLNVPATYHGYPVLGIINNGFSGCANLVSVTIPSSVRYIGNTAFTYCVNLETVVGMQNVEYVGSSAFVGCVKLRVFIQELQHVCESACQVCGKCTNANCQDEACVEKCNTPHVVNGDYIFTLINNKTAYAVAAYNKNLTRYDIPATYNGLPVTEIVNGGFVKCNKAEVVTIPDTVVKIGDNAFSRVSDVKIYGMANVREIGLNALTNSCYLYISSDYQNHTCSHVCDICGKCADEFCMFGECQSEKCQHDAVQRVIIYDNNGLFYTLSLRGDCYYVTGWDKDITTLNIPEKHGSKPIVAITAKAFLNCQNLVSVTIPATVRVIGDSAFSNCINLETVTINGDLEYVGMGAFYNCYKLRINILHTPHTCKNVCLDCGKCKDADCHNEVCLDKCDSNPETHPMFRFTLINDGTAYAVSANNKTFTRYEIPESYNGLPVTEIAERGFEQIRLGTAVVVIVPDSIVKIGAKAFYNCTLLTVYGMKNVTEMDAGALAYYHTSCIYIGDNDTSHACNDVCSRCGKCADIYCKRSECKLKCSCNVKPFNLVCESVCPDCGKCRNFNCNEAACSSKCESGEFSILYYTWNSNYSGFEVRASSIDMSKLANLTVLSIPSTWHGYPVVAISDQAFVYCRSLTTVIIPSTIRAIGRSAFQGTKLETVIGMQGVEYMESNAFWDCFKLKIYIQEPQHACENICHLCNGCANENCVDPACLYKCTHSAHACHTACSECGKCKNPLCIDPACVEKCDNNIYHTDYNYTLINNGTAYAVAANNKNRRLYDIHATYNGLPVTEIAAYGFDGCDNMRTVIIPNSVIKIGEYAFSNCGNGQAKFYGMYGVREICEGAFFGQVAGLYFTDDYYNHECHSICSQCGHCNDEYCKLEQCNVKCHIISAQQTSRSYNVDGITYKLNKLQTGYAVYSVAKDITAVNIPVYFNGLPVVEISYGAFNGCANLTSITIPATVRFIGNDAFRNCDNLETIYINGELSLMCGTAIYRAEKIKIYIKKDYHDCESHCPVCNDCTNAYCEQFDCIRKCDCQTALYTGKADLQ